MMKTFNVVDLFSGGGGLSEGFHRQGFNIISYVEMDKYACQSLATRHAYHILKENDMLDIYYEYLKERITSDDLFHYIKDPIPVINKEITGNTIPEIKKEIKRNMERSKIKSIDVFIGGPPCQAYSLVGRARDPYNMEHDNRNTLYKYYVELLKEFKPDIFIFENVPGILSAGKGKLFSDMRSHFKNAGYWVDYKPLDASEFMVLQKRKRIILIGWRNNLNLSYPEFTSLKHKYLVKDLLYDLPPLNPGRSAETGDYITEPSKYLLKSGIRDCEHEDILLRHITRPINWRDRQIYKRAITLWRKKGERLKYSDLPLSLKTHRNEISFSDRFKVVADSLPHSHTVVAHIAKDGHYYIHPDEKQLRSISVREAARLQSFPDDYQFEGPRTSQLVQIGNAVPPLMADKIAEKIKKMLK
ncbi:MAG TPA: DNA cytosine methyltransferase [Candidatus Methanoperedens sp.]